MTNPSREHLEKTLTALFDAERSARKLHDELAEAPNDEVISVLTDAINAAMKEPLEEEAALRLVRIANVLGTLDGPRVVDSLIDVLGSEWPEARDAAGQELEGFAYERFKEVALGVERALKRLPAGSPALQELPYILSEIPEPGVSKLLVEFLQHEDAEAVAAALTVAVEMGDGSLAKHVKKLVGDKRVAEMEDDGPEGEEEQGTITIGELAEEALEVLEVMDSEGAQDES